MDEYASGDPYAVEEGGAFHRNRIEMTIELAREVRPKRILDVGCGEGHITNEIAKALPDAEVHGFDLSPAAIATAAAAYPGINFSVANALDQYPAGPFDLIVCNNLWEHVTAPLLLLSRMADVLAPGGSIIISTPSRYRVSNLVRAARGKPVAMMSRHHVTEYTVGQMHEMLKAGGFRVAETRSRIISPKGRIAGAMLAPVLRAVGSHHALAETVFYLARHAKELTAPLECSAA